MAAGDSDAEFPVDKCFDEAMEAQPPRCGEASAVPPRIASRCSNDHGTLPPPGLAVPHKDEAKRKECSEMRGADGRTLPKVGGGGRDTASRSSDEQQPLDTNDAPTEAGATTTPTTEVELSSVSTTLDDKRFFHSGSSATDIPKAACTAPSRRRSYSKGRGGLADGRDRGSNPPPPKAAPQNKAATPRAAVPIPAPGEDSVVLARRAKLKKRLEAKKKEKELSGAKQEEMRQLVDDIMAGKFKNEGGGQKKGNMLIKMPTPADRANTRKLILGQFREQYRKIGNNTSCPSTPIPKPATQLYAPGDAQGLQIEGAHRPFPRPDHVDLPCDYRKNVGVLSLPKLREFNSDCRRLLVSVYGDIFDVSDRPDKYGPDGPYSWMAGHDLTWGFVSGRDTPEQVDQCYDLWKVAPDFFRDEKLKLIYAWVGFYEYEYGDAVGRLDLYEREAGLKGPPMEDAQNCCVM